MPIQTRTLATIYLEQGHLREAFEIVRGLVEREPANRENLVLLSSIGDEVERRRGPGAGGVQPAAVDRLKRLIARSGRQGGEG